MANKARTMREILEDMTPQDFLNVGMNEIGYIRPLRSAGTGAGFSLHAADGTQLSVMETRDMAVAAAHMEHHLIPVTVH